MTSKWPQAPFLAALMALGGCTSYVDQAREACASYGLADDPRCIMQVAETRQQQTLQAVQAAQMSYAISTMGYSFPRY